MNTLKTVLGFAVGAAAGVLATQRYFKEKYEKMYQEDLRSMKETFQKQDLTIANNVVKSTPKTEETPNEQEKDDRIAKTANISEYKKIVGEEGYTDYSNLDAHIEKITEEPSTEVQKPYVISPMEFGEFGGYDTITLIYHADHILTCDDEIVEDVEGCVGFESLTHFGDYEDDSVHVRNDRLRVDYEILLDHRKYSDVVKSKPYLLEDE